MFSRWIWLYGVSRGTTMRRRRSLSMTSAARRAGFTEVRGQTLFPGVCGLVTAVRA